MSRIIDIVDCSWKLIKVRVEMCKILNDITYVNELPAEIKHGKYNQYWGRRVHILLSLPNEQHLVGWLMSTFKSNQTVISYRGVNRTLQSIAFKLNHLQ